MPRLKLYMLFFSVFLAVHESKASSSFFTMPEDLSAFVYGKDTNGNVVLDPFGNAGDFKRYCISTQSEKAYKSRVNQLANKIKTVENSLINSVFYLCGKSHGFNVKNIWSKALKLSPKGVLKEIIHPLIKSTSPDIGILATNIVAMNSYLSGKLFSRKKIILDNYKKYSLSYLEDLEKFSVSNSQYKRTDSIENKKLHIIRMLEYITDRQLLVQKYENKKTFPFSHIEDRATHKVSENAFRKGTEYHRYLKSPIFTEDLGIGTLTLASKNRIISSQDLEEFERLTQKTYMRYGSLNTHYQSSIEALASMYNSIGEYKKSYALTHILYSLNLKQINLKTVRIAIRLANLAYSNGLYQNAKQVAQEIISFKNDDLYDDHYQLKEARFILGKSLLALGESKKALEVLKQSVCLKKCIGETSQSEKILHLFQASLRMGQEIPTKYFNETTFNNDENSIMRVFSSEYELISHRNFDWETDLNVLRSEKKENTSILALSQMGYATHLLRKNNYIDSWKIILDASKAVVKKLKERLPIGADNLAGWWETPERHILVRQLEIADKILKQSNIKNASKKEIYNQIFLTSQYLIQSHETIEFVKLAKRLEATSPETAKLIRQQQDILFQIKSSETEISETVDELISQNDKTIEIAKLNTRIVALRTQFEKVSEKLRNISPKYAGILDFEPISLSQFRKSLRENDIYVFFVPYGDKVFRWVITNQEIDFKQLPVSRGNIRSSLQSIRENMNFKTPVMDLNVKAYFDLYKALLADALTANSQKNNLVISPFKEFYSIPFSALISKKPPNKQALSSIDWLIKSHTITITPSPFVFSFLRTNTGKKINKSEKYVGIGDPELKGLDEISPGLNSGGFEDLINRGVGIARTVQQLPPLSGSDRELRALASVFGKRNSNIYLKNQAVERTFFTSEVSKANVLAFSTHALLSGELQELDEPALVMTPVLHPANEASDGLLKASEIAAQNLNADWVILAACNTGAQKSGVGLSELVKSFVFAGAKSVLASHWKVENEATSILISKAAELLKNNPSLTRSEALRKAMLHLIQSANNTQGAHPAFWSAFFNIGA
ncbi:CHAT domain-containing protein [Terasakiella pusilla]|uniref:CHAT domain-containing protein n=1 Tax=Terasakiella pusilla TaxID=64973 RepID=UPI003AA8BC85